MSKNHAILNQSTGEAKLKYFMKEFHIIEFGTFVFCAETGKKIHLSDLKYWNVERQEPYADAHASLKRELSLKNA